MSQKRELAKIRLEYTFPNSFQNTIKEIWIDPEKEDNIKLWIDEEFGEILDYLEEKRLRREIPISTPLA